MVDLLDAIGPDPDLEEELDREPDQDREGDNADDEPSLGSPHALNQVDAWRYAGDDREEEHDGAEPDVQNEPSCGSTHSINQERAWDAPAGWAAIVTDGEPSPTVPEQMNQARAWAYPGDRQELEEQCEDEGSDSDREPEEGVPMARTNAQPLNQLLC